MAGEWRERTVAAAHRRQEPSTMLVVSSNWCVSDGTLSAGPPRGSVGRFRAEVRRASLRFGFRRDGRYRPADGIDLVLAGDTFDWLVSREWTGDVRPWEGGRRAAAARERVVADAFVRGRRLLATLTDWMRRGIDVPVADPHGRPMPGTMRRVPVRVVMLCGDRDRWLEHAGRGLTRPDGTPVVGRCWSDGDVTVRHGDDLDPLHTPSGGEPSLGESLAVDLIARFVAAIDDIPAVRPRIGGLVRRLAGGPPLEAPARLVRWLAAQDRASTLPATARRRCVDAWHRSVVLWHRAARRLSPRGGDGVDLVGVIAECLDLGTGRETGTMHRWADACPTPGMAFPWDSATTIVLGHPVAVDATSTAWRRKVICLGSGDLPTTSLRDEDLQGPSAVVLRPDRGDRRIEWLPIDAVLAGNGGQDEALPWHGVWLSAASRSRAGIVDAA